MDRDLAPEGQRWRCPLNGCKFNIKCRWELSSTSRPHCKNSHPGLSGGTYIIQNATLVSEVEGRILNAEYYRELREGVQTDVAALPTPSDAVPDITVPNMTVPHNTVPQRLPARVGPLQLRTSTRPTRLSLESDHQSAFSFFHQPPPLPPTFKPLPSSMVDQLFNSGSSSAAINSLQARGSSQGRQNDLPIGVKKFRCYVCSRLLSNPNVVRVHFGLHKHISEPFQPDRVAAVWCDKTTHKPIELASSPTLVKQFQQKSLTGVCPEVRFLILRELLSQPQHPSDVNGDGISYECFSFLDHPTLALRTEAKDVLIKSNFLIRIVIYHDVGHYKDMNLIRDLFRDMSSVIRTEITGEIEHCDLEMSVKTRANINSGTSLKYETLLAYNEALFARLCSAFFCYREDIGIMKVSFQASSMFPRAGRTVQDVIRFLACLCDLYQVQVEGLPASMDPAHLEETMQYQASSSSNRLMHVWDVVKMGKKLVDQGEYMRALTILSTAQTVDNRMRTRATHYRGAHHDYLADGAYELRCRYALLRLRAVNLQLEQEPKLLHRRREGRIRFINECVIKYAADSTRSPVISDLHRGLAHLEKGKLYRFCGDADIVVGKPPPDSLLEFPTGLLFDEFESFFDRDSEMEVDGKNYLATGLRARIAELPNRDQQYIEAAKQFYLAWRILEAGQQQEYAENALARIEARLNFTMDDDLAGFTSEMISDGDEWRGERKMIQLWRKRRESLKERFCRPEWWDRHFSE